MGSIKNTILDTTWSRLETALNLDESDLYTETRPKTTHSVRKSPKSSRYPASPNMFCSPSISRSGYNRLRRTVTPNTSARNSQIISGLTSDQIKRIYAAKCADLEIPVLGDQEYRFVNFCIQHFGNRKFNMKESGIREITAKVIGDIIQNNDNFAYIDLSKNLLRDDGA